MKNTNENVKNNEKTSKFDYNKELYTIIGLRIKQRRLELQIPIAKISKSLSITSIEFENIENGNQKFSVDLLAKISMLLNLDKLYLLTGIKNKNLVENLKILNNYIEFFKMFQSMSAKNRERFISIIDNKTSSRRVKKI